MPALALADIVRTRLGGRPLTIPLAGRRGDLAMLTTPDAMDGGQALDPDGRYEWDQTIAARSVMRLTWYRPGRGAAKVRCPMLVITARDDRSALAAPAVKAARRAPDAELVELEGGHYAPFQESYEQARDAALDFLDRHLRA
jgi:pimeloyl-ACP methyl ester carboxylesterase